MTLNRWEPKTLREQINRVFADVLERTAENRTLPPGRQRWTFMKPSTNWSLRQTCQM
jgi:hypothetical protein